jgi:tetratricopeptide (TPR) repeat protein
LIKNIFIISFIGISVPVLAGVWDIEPDIPDYDPVWQNIDNLWNKCERNPVNISEIISIADALTKKYPEKAEPLLWLAWGYQQKGLRGGSSERPKLLRQSVDIAKKSYDIDGNIKAFKILVGSGNAFKNYSEIKSIYGTWIKKTTPLAGGRELPEMNQYTEWKPVIQLWDARSDIKNAQAAVDIFKKIADREKGDINAQIWVCRATYYLGRYYEFDNQIEKSVSIFVTGVEYGNRALKINKNNVPANYWFFMNLGRSIEHKSLFVKVANSKSMMDNVLLFVIENPLYFYCSPIMAISDMLTEAGVVMGNIMEIFGVNTQQIITSLELAEVCYPTYFRISLCKAQILANIDQEEAAKKILNEICGRDPKVDTYQTADNSITQREAKALLAELK